MKLLPLLIACISFALSGIPTSAASIGSFKADTVLFLGDSITHSGHYISYIESRLRQDNGNEIPQIINLGLPSETCSGLSEPDHPFPRPDVHERLDRALAKIKPDLVFACYGMNDGIYHPFSEDRFAAYQTGVGKLIRKVKATGAKLVLITPPPFDPLPLHKKGKLLPAGRDKYAWFEIYENYDGVLQRYSNWLKTQAGRVDGFVDVRSPISRAQAARRETEPAFTMSNDGVHIDKLGHELFAIAVMKFLGIGDTKDLNPDLFKLVESRHKVMHLAWLDHVGHKRPGPNSKISFAEARKRADVVETKIAELLNGNGGAVSVGLPKSVNP